MNHFKVRDYYLIKTIIDFLKSQTNSSEWSKLSVFSQNYIVHLSSYMCSANYQPSLVLQLFISAYYYSTLSKLQLFFIQSSVFYCRCCCQGSWFSSVPSQKAVPRSTTISQLLRQLVCCNIFRVSTRITYDALHLHKNRLLLVDDRADDGGGGGGGCG